MINATHYSERLANRAGPLSSGRLRARLSLTVLVAALAILVLASPAQADFGLSEFGVAFTDKEGNPVTQAGSHPYEMTTNLHFISTPVGEGGETVEEAAKDVLLTQAPGFLGNPTALPRCSTSDFLTGVPSPEGLQVADCPDASAVGITTVKVASISGSGSFFGAVYNLQPPPGAAAKLGFWIGGFPVTLELGVAETPPYNIVGGPTNITQVLEVISADFTLWGNPAEAAHDPLRGHCLSPADEELSPGPPPVFRGIHSLGECPANVSEVPFLTLPRSCDGPLRTAYRIDSWQNPGIFKEGFTETAGMSGCGKLGFNPSIGASPTSKAAASPTGLDFSLDVKNEGLLNPDGVSDADIEKTVVTLPQGMTVNPSQAEGLEVCSEADLANERADSAPGEGCPEASKIGSVEVETPLLEDEILRGSLFVAEPYANLAGDSLIAIYVVIKDSELGVIFKQPIKVEPDPQTGQLISTAADIPQWPFSHFRLHFREGGRSPLISPPGCGVFEATAKLYPSSGAAPLETGSAFQIVSGPDSSPCPQGAAPFNPGFEAGTNNNAASHYSPFYMRLTRADGEQDMTRFSSVLPPGVVGKIAGIPYCSEAAIAQAKSRTGAHGGQEELDNPSCPAASQIGRTIAGAGVGSQLTYVPGKLYLAGPFHGDPLSVVAITPAVAGPFDAGTVVVREALALNPVTAEVEVDGSASDPIPHILKGIPLSVRDLRVYADRPDFTLNATSCAEEQAKATLWGGGTPLLPTAETPVGLSSRYQAADCGSLGFKPKLAIKLKGGTKRGGHPALKAVVTPRPGDANFARAVVTLPRSAFLDQGHIRTICTRVQFAAGAGNGAECPAGAQYGFARAWTPILDEPATGPVFLRSSNHNLPDLVVALQGPPSAAAKVELSARIDSVKGGIRSTFAGIPDFPVSRFVLEMQGGKKGLIVNSIDLCVSRHRAKAELNGQNGKLSRVKPLVEAIKCGGKAGGKRRGGSSAR